jgi:hypothetical protein
MHLLVGFVVLEGLGRGTFWAKTGLYMSANPCTACVLCKRSAALPNTVKGDNPQSMSRDTKKKCVHALMKNMILF